MAAEFAARRLDRRAPGRRGATPLAGSLARLRAWQKGLGYQFENANPVSNLCKYNLGCALFQEVLRDGKHEYSNKMR